MTKSVNGKGKGESFGAMTIATTFDSGAKSTMASVDSYGRGESSHGLNSAQSLSVDIGGAKDGSALSAGLIGGLGKSSSKL